MASHHHPQHPAQPWNGVDELYRSGHTDTIDMGAVKSICNVMTLRDYLVWRACEGAEASTLCTQAKPQLEEHDFFWRFTYVPMANGGRFEDEATATCVMQFCTGPAVYTHPQVLHVQHAIQPRPHHGVLLLLSQLVRFLR